MVITYTKNGDYLMPDLVVSQENRKIGKYGRIRKTYLKEHKSMMYTRLILMGELDRHLAEMDQTASQWFDQIVADMTKQNGITEELKARDPMKWVGLMNNIRDTAEEIILKELIYSET